METVSCPSSLDRGRDYLRVRESAARRSLVQLTPRPLLVACGGQERPPLLFVGAPHARRVRHRGWLGIAFGDAENSGHRSEPTAHVRLGSIHRPVLDQLGCVQPSYLPSSRNPRYPPDGSPAIPRTSGLAPPGSDAGAWFQVVASRRPAARASSATSRRARLVPRRPRGVFRPDRVFR